MLPKFLNNSQFKLALSTRFFKFVIISISFLTHQDPYITRPMPYLIGTPQFMEDDNVGLMEDVSGKI